MSDNQKDDAPDRLLTRAQVLEIVPLSYTTLWEMMRRGDFPRAVKITANRVAWSERLVRAWVASRPRQKLKGDAEQNQGAAAITTSREGTNNE